MQPHQLAALSRQCESVRLHAARHLYSQQQVLKAIEQLRSTLTPPSLPAADFARFWNEKRLELAVIRKTLNDRKA